MKVRSGVVLASLFISLTVSAAWYQNSDMVQKGSDIPAKSLISIFSLKNDEDMSARTPLLDLLAQFAQERFSPMDAAELRVTTVGLSEFSWNTSTICTD
jgi:hypothetical protein